MLKKTKKLLHQPNNCCAIGIKALGFKLTTQTVFISGKNVDFEPTNELLKIWVQLPGYFCTGLIFIASVKIISDFVPLSNTLKRVDFWSTGCDTLNLQKTITQ